MKKRNRILAFAVAFALAVSPASLTNMMSPPVMAAETTENACSAFRQEAANLQKTKQGFDIDLSQKDFNGSLSVDLSKENDGVYLQVLNNLLQQSGDQTLVFRFKTTNQNALFFGMGDEPPANDTDEKTKGTSTTFGLRSGQLRMVLRNAENKGGLKGAFSSGLADGSWHTVAVSLLPSKEKKENNVRLVIDGGSELYGTTNWYKNWVAGLNQRKDKAYTTFLAGNGKYVNQDSAGEALKGKIEFISLVNKEYSVDELKKITSGDKNAVNFTNDMMANGTNYTWLFTGGTETVADVKSLGTTRNYVGMFEENLRLWGTYVERSRYVYNTAKRGAGVKEILAEYQERVSRFQSKVVAIMIGEADYQKGAEGLAEFKDNLKKFVEKVQSEDKYPMIITPYASQNSSTQKNIDLYKEAVTDTVGKTVKVIQLSDVSRSQIREDGSLTPLGHQQISNAIKTQLGLPDKHLTNNNFSLAPGSYSFAKQNARGGEETAVEYARVTDAGLEIQVPANSLTQKNAVLGYMVTNGQGQEITGEAVAGKTNFVIQGLLPNQTYKVSVYEKRQEDTGIVKETYKPLEVTMNAGAQGKTVDYPQKNQQGNEKIKSLLTRETPVTYLFMGDSITHGILTFGYDNVPQMFAKYLDEIGRANDIVVNAGVTNATLSHTLDQMDHRLRKYDPDVVMVMLGTNDSSVLGELVEKDKAEGNGVNQFKQRYKRLVKGIYDNNKDTSIVLRVPCEMLVDANHSEYKKFFATIQEVVNESRTECPGLNICLIDHMAEWRRYEKEVRNDNIAQKTTYGWLYDIVHPNGRGNLSMFQQIVNELGIYKNTSEMANYAYRLSDWTETGSMTAPVKTSGTSVSFDMGKLKDSGKTLTEVTLKAQDAAGKVYEKTMPYAAGSVIALEGLEEGKPYFYSLTAKDATTKREISYAVEQSMNLEFDEAKTYIMYSAYDGENTETKGKNRVAFDENGTIKFDNAFENTHKSKYRFRMKKDGSVAGSYFVRNAETKYPLTGNASATNVTTDKTANATGGSYVFEVKEIKDGRQYVAIRSNASKKYISPNANGTASFTANGNDKKNWWCVEEISAMNGLDGTKLLWTTPTDNIFYRIPAIATANDGTLIAVSDARYNNNSDLGDNWANCPRGHQIDLVYRTSGDNGATWSADTNITKGYSVPDNGKDRASGYGDAAIVADRESGRVLLMAASGTKGFVSKNKEQNCSRMYSEDNGKTFSKPDDIQADLYKLNDKMQAFFCSSGRIMQSRYIKVGEYYRVYIALLGHDGNFNNKRNWVIYSDDFGKNWAILGDTVTSPAPAGDEAKIEELPNRSVVISSRVGNGRYFNIFDYSDNSYKTGSWQKEKLVTLGNGQATNGELGIVYAKNKMTGKYCYLALQSLPAGPGRTHVAIYYKELTDKDVTVDGFAEGWSDSKRLMVQENASAYSTWAVQPDGTIGFYWEEADCWYDMAYRSISISEITHGEYEAAFTGIGSQLTPYVVSTKEQKKAVEEIFKNEKVHWDMEVDRIAGERQTILSNMQQVISGGNTSYSKESWDALIAAYEKAKNTEDLPETEIKKIFDDLDKAFRGLVKVTVTNPPGDTGNLVTQIKLSAPNNVKVTSSIKGTKISYQKVQNAVKYEIYRKIASGSFKLLGSTSADNYLDTKPSPGKQNTYMVKAVGAGNFLTSDHSKEAGIKLPAQAKKLKVKGRKGGALIQYGKLPGGCSLVVYRSTKKTGGFKKVKVLSRKYTSYLDRKAKKGKVYYKILVKKGKIYAPAQVKMTRVK